MCVCMCESAFVRLILHEIATMLKFIHVPNSNTIADTDDQPIV